MVRVEGIGHVRSPLLSSPVGKSHGYHEAPQSPLNELHARLITAAKDALPPSPSLTSRVLEEYLGIRSWLQVLGHPDDFSLQESGAATARFSARVAATGAGALGTVQLGGIGFTLGGPVGLAAGVLAGAAGTLLLSHGADAAARVLLRFMAGLSDPRR